MQKFPCFLSLQAIEKRSTYTDIEYFYFVSTQEKVILAVKYLTLTFISLNSDRSSYELSRFRVYCLKIYVFYNDVIKIPIAIISSKSSSL